MQICHQKQERCEVTANKQVDRRLRRVEATNRAKTAVESILGSQDASFMEGANNSAFWFLGWNQRSSPSSDLRTHRSWREPITVRYDSWAVIGVESSPSSDLRTHRSWRESIRVRYDSWAGISGRVHPRISGRIVHGGSQSQTHRSWRESIRVRSGSWAGISGRVHPRISGRIVHGGSQSRCVMVLGLTSEFKSILQFQDASFEDGWEPIAHLGVLLLTAQIYKSI
ncbi:hypothetical protein J6590_067283 [Homalodisca vitripennis]|nr:hypothetical protein J6590_067283 [Homalodisca vitripennis]